jgi:CheY-like chemotaxis protein
VNTPKNAVLLVEDDFMLRSVLAELLMQNGYEVECVADGLEAFHYLNSGRPKPAVILLDLMMPQMDGIEFRAVQRSIPSMSDVPVVVITASIGGAMEAAALGVDRMLFKPINSSRLLETLRELVPPA